MQASRVSAPGTHRSTAREETEQFLVSALLHWPYTPDADSPSVLLLSPSGNGKSHLIHHAVRRARSLIAPPHASEPPASSSSSVSKVLVVTPSLADAIASQQRDGATSLRAVCRRAAVSAIQRSAAVPSSSTDTWAVLVHFDHTEHFLCADGDAASATGGTGGANRTESRDQEAAESGLAAFSAYPALMADLYAVLRGCPPLFSHEECLQLHLRRIVFAASFSTERGGLDLHPFAREKLFDIRCHLSTPSETERRLFFLRYLARSAEADATANNLHPLAQRTGGLTYAGLVEVADLWRWQQRQEPQGTQRPETTTPLIASAAAQRVVARFRASGTVAAQQCRHSAGFIDVQVTRWDDIAGMESVKIQLQQMVTRPLLHYAQYQQRGVRHSTGVLLHGPPGTGKTMLAKAMATELNASFIYIDLPELVQAEVGESERKLKAFFDVARQRSPAVIFMDELQAAFGVRYNDPAHGPAVTPASLSAGSSHDARLVSHLLQLLDAAQEDTSHLIIFVGATNVVHLLDPLLLRPGRLDTHLAVPLPDDAARERLARRVVCGEWDVWFAAATSQTARVQEALVSLFVAASQGMSGAELRTAMSVFALRLVQACLSAATPTGVDSYKGQSTDDDGQVAERLIAFLQRQGGIQGDAIEDVLSDAALALAQKAFATGRG